MALVANGFAVSVTLADMEGDETVRRYVSTAADMTEAEGFAADLLAALAGMTDDVVASYQIESLFANDAFALPIVAGTENFNQALLEYQLDALGVKKATQSIPAPKIGIFMTATGPGAKKVDVADAAVIAWRTLFQTGGGFTISDGETVDILLSGKRRSVRSTNG